MCVQYPVNADLKEEIAYLKRPAKALGEWKTWTRAPPPVQVEASRIIRCYFAKARVCQCFFITSRLPVIRNVWIEARLSVTKLTDLKI